MKKYELKYEKGDIGVFAMSTVANPATQTTLVMFDDERELLQFQDDDKQEVYAVAMRPNILIPRKNIKGEPAMVFYTEETVKDLQQNFFKMNSHNGGTVNHNGIFNGDMYFFESWIVKDPERDKATLLGMDVKEGDWVLGQKVEDPVVWEKIKNKELTGFSIEAFLEPILTNEEINMGLTPEEVDERIKKILMETEEEKKAAQLKEEDAKLAMVEAPPTDTAPVDDELQKKVEELTTENTELKAKIAELEGKSVEMSEQLEASKKQVIEMEAEIEKGIKPNPSGEVDKDSIQFKAEQMKKNRLN